VTPQPGDFSLTKIRGGAGWFIRLGQALLGEGFRDYEHAYVNLGDGWIIEAEPGGAAICADHYDPATTVTSDWVLSDAQRHAIVVAARTYSLIPYSFLDYVALVAHRWHIPVPGLRRYISSTGHVICSQLVDQVMLDAGVHLFADGRWPGYVSPADLYPALHGPVVAP
jgi:hypothetical protein